MEEESERRKERLQAMRMEAVQGRTGTENDQQISQSAPGILSNPFNDSSPAPTSHNNPRFDYYTDPLAAFSSNKKKGKIGNNNNNNSNQSPNGCHNRPRMMMSPMNASTPVKSYVQQNNFHGGSLQSPADPSPFGSPVSPYSMSSGPQYYGSPFGFSTSSNESPLPISPVPRFNHPSPPLLQQQHQNQSGPQPRGSINSSSGSPVPMSSAPRFNMDNTWSQQSDFQQPNSQPPPSSQSGTQHRQFYNSTNESPVPQTPVRRFSQIPSKDNFWSQQSYSQQQHQQTQIESQPMHYSNSSNESPGPLTPVPRINPVPNKDSFRLPPPHSQPSPPLKQQQQQQQHQSGSQPRQYNGPPGQGSSWLDPRQSPVGRGSAWSGTQGSCSPSSGSSGRGVSWSEPQGSSGGRGTPWMNSRDRGGRAVGGTPSPNQIRGRMQGRGSHVHVSARERPDLFVKKSMVEDPWKNLVPVLMNNLVATGVGNTGMCRSKGSCFDVNNPRSFQPGSISLKKPKVSQIKDNFQSGPSLAESLALSFSEAIGEEACS